MPGWHKKTKKLQASGKIQIVGIIQEQHAERCRLFKQWQKFDWPILVDSLNLYGLPGIPIAMAVDEQGILRASNIRPDKQLQKFLSMDANKSASKASLRDYRAVDTFSKRATARRTAQNLLDWGSAEFLYGDLDHAIDAFRLAGKLEPENAIAAFRLGVALRRRLDAGGLVETDFQEASEAWSKALDLNPGQYIWRRRIQQFGPRLQKPYNFYRWIAEAQQEIIARGEKPVRLSIPLTASEKMQKSDEPEALSHKNPDAKKQVPHDNQKIASLSRAVVPSRSKPKGTVRLHVLLLPNKKMHAHWDPNAGPIKLWLEGDSEWKRPGALAQSQQILTSSAARSIEMEIAIPENAKTGRHTLKGYVLYPICEYAGGTCQFLRQEFSVDVEVK